MSKMLKSKGNSVGVTLIENQSVRASSRSIVEPSRIVAAGALPPGGGLPALVSMPLCVTPFSFLAMPEGSE